jgi:hypothetical protein
MVDRFAAEDCANWAEDFASSDTAALFPAAIRDAIPQVAGGLLTAACAVRGTAVDAITREDLTAAMLTRVARMPLPAEVHAFVPSMCRAFLTDLQHRGRLAGGEGLGRHVGALKSAYQDACRDTPAPFVRPGAKIGRNDPCLCGSGKKYKNCCGR